MNEYEEIFAGVQDAADLPFAIARAVRLLRAAMEKEDNCAVTTAHVRNLSEIEPSALAMAYAAAEKSCTYWPTPGQIRELAGWSEESRARTSLKWVFQYLSLYGVEGRPRGGGVRFGEDETGQRVLLPSEPVIAAPCLPEEIAAALALVGCGTSQDGLRYVSQHPVVKGWEGLSGEAGSRTAERIEGQWIRCYVHMVRKLDHPPNRRS